MDLSGFVTTNQNTGLLLTGTWGMSMKEDALNLAKHLLKTQTPESSSDFLLIAPKENKKSIGVEEILPVIEKGALPPIHSRFSVAVIDGIERLSVPAQNKLLILLEANPYVFVIAIAYGNGVLDTVKSRMRQVIYHPLSKESFLSSIDLPKDEAEVLCAASGGCLNLALTLTDDLPLFLAVAKCVESEKTRHLLLKHLHLLKEKDKQAITEKPDLMLYILRILQEQFHKLSIAALTEQDYENAARYQQITEALLKEEQILLTPGYSKDDFFCCILQCME